MNDIAAYFIALAKLNTNDEETTKLIAEKLTELLNAELDACLAIVDEQNVEWGETAVRVNRIAGLIAGKIRARKRA